MIQCPKCESENIKPNGFRRNKHKADKRRYICECGYSFSIESEEDSTYITEDELVIENVRFKKQTQRFQDSNRVERKAFREYARVENAVSEYNKQLISILEKYNLASFTIKHDDRDSKAAGIFQLSDLHFNELVNLVNNKYDFPIAAKRCKKFVTKAIKYFKLFNVSSVLIACSGDFLNSDRRIDELLNQATNRSKATFLAVQILEQVIIELNQHFNISVMSVSGNESRIHKDWEWSDALATDNYDFTIFNILRMLFRNSEGVHFIIGENSVEQVVEIGGQNVLVLHGINMKSKTEESIQNLMGKYSAKGIEIDFVIYGHYHSARLGDFYARSSSMVGSNDYSDKGLGLIGSASQNIHVIYNKNERDSIKIDLQDTTGIEGYDITKELEAYNAKSLDKVRKQETIFKIVI